ncbi:MAG TPA: sulfatase-like hydrolase/transferase [Terriglobales bacterium]|nr:sulfatase-like hydrolase/transferase [Terriglobales bacterium]
MQVFRNIAALLAISCVAFSAEKKQAPRPRPTESRSPNVILITLDTTRADRMGFLGSDRGLTPNLDQLASQGVVFTHAYAQVPLTTPSHAALLTGTYPQFNQVEDLGAQLLPDVPYLPDLLHKRGYHTAAFVGAYILDPRGAAPGFDRGFDFYNADFHARKPGEDRYKTVERRAEDVANRALGWISRHPQGPFFVWMHFYDAHDPYDPPPPFKDKYAQAPYDGEIAYTDSVVGSFIEVLKRHDLYRNTVIAVAADHGEAFGEHGEERHGMFLYDETIHVPLLMKLPSGRFAGERIDARVAIADIAPSLLEAAGGTPPKQMQAKSLLPLMDPAKKPAQSKAAEQQVYSETNYPNRAFGWSELRSWRAGKYLYVQAPKRELYDQAADPGEVQNLAPSTQAITDTLDSQLSQFYVKTRSAQTEHAGIDPAQAESLRALGYLASDSPAQKDKSKAVVDPKDKIAIANEMHRALVDIEEDRYDEAIAGLQDVVRKEPDAATGYLELGRALVHQRRFDDALPALRAAAERTPDSGMAHYELALALIKTGQWDAALPELQAAVVCTPKSAQMHFYLAAVHLRLKHFPEATAEFDKALELDSDHFLANLKYGEMLLLEGKADAALPKLNKAVKLEPKSAEAHAFLSRAFEELGQKQNAERERAIAAGLKPSTTE